MDDTGPNTKHIEVTFIRHAETIENVKENISCEGIEALKNFKLPSFEQVKQAINLLSIHNSPVSDLGKRQILDMKMILQQKKFWDRYDFDLCVYSPLMRAKETCHGIVPEDRHSKCIPLELIREIQLQETIFPFLAIQRVAEFEKWLQTAPVTKLLVVGHSVHLGKLLGLKSLMRNCDVWRATYSIDCSKPDALSGKFDEPTLLYRTELSVPHQSDGLFKWPSSKDKPPSPPSNPLSATDPNVHDLDNNKPDEPTCRFCQCTQSEEPTKKLIRPCKCAGSASFVHVDCLNTWRATSTSAYFTCSVCKYDYQFQRTLLAELTTREEFVIFIAILMILFSLIFCGVIVTLLCEYLNLEESIADRIYRMTQVDEYWQVCRTRDLPLFSSLIAGIYKNSNGVNDAIKSYIRVIRSPLPMLYFICHPIVGMCVNILVSGATMVSTIGFVIHFYKQFQQMRMFGQAHWLQYVVMTAMWFTSLGNSAMSRVWLVMGCAVATREVYLVLIVYARQLSHWLGDIILEPAL